MGTWSNWQLNFTGQTLQLLKHEPGNRDPGTPKIKHYPNAGFFTPFASFSGNFVVMFICGCSTGTFGRISSGIAKDMIARIADLMLKNAVNLLLSPVKPQTNRFI
jgi:3-polyprenyl-4-hydroxybenzoate decarboxylase